MVEYIERDAAIETVTFYLGDPDGVDHALQSIKGIPTADVQPVKWISVYDQLPDYNMVVLVTDGEDVGTGYRYALGETGFTGWAVPFADIEEDDVSHWMPLPEPPKDGETDG